MELGACTKTVGLPVTVPTLVGECDAPALTLALGSSVMLAVLVAAPVGVLVPDAELLLVLVPDCVGWPLAELLGSTVKLELDVRAAVPVADLVLLALMMPVPVPVGVLLPLGSTVEVPLTLGRTSGVMLGLDVTPAVLVEVRLAVLLGVLLGVGVFVGVLVGSGHWQNMGLPRFGITISTQGQKAQSADSSQSAPFPSLGTHEPKEHTLGCAHSLFRTQAVTEATRSPNARPFRMKPFPALLFRLNVADPIDLRSTIAHSTVIASRPVVSTSS